MQTQENWREQGKPNDPVTTPSEPVISSSEPVMPAAEPIAQPEQQKQAEQQEQSEQQEQPGGPADSVPLPAEPGLEEKLAEAQSRVAEMQDAFLRAKAEVENFRRRAQEDVIRAHKYAIEGFADALVPVKDSLEAALAIDTSSVESYKQGVEMTLKQLSSAFAKNQLMEINPTLGDKFDPAKHQAISMVPADQNANTIVSVLQKGYMIADRLLRPALVTVSQEKSS